MLGREREAADAFAVIRAGRPAEFYAACGYGKTTLLDNVAATCAARILRWLITDAVGTLMERSDGWLTGCC